MKDATLKQAVKLVELFEDVHRERLQMLFESGLLADLRDADIAKIDRDVFRQFVGLPPINSPLLEPIGTIVLPASERFAASEHFVVDISSAARVKISWIDNNFQGNFLAKIEEPQPGQELCYSKLTRPELDGSIMAELGDKRETTLAQVFALMALQPNGEKGISLTNGSANVFYVRDMNGSLWALSVRWIGRGWFVSAHSVSDPGRWGGGRRVFSRNS